MKLRELSKLALAIGGFVLSTVSTYASDYENPLFAYTHLLPSPFTLPAGKLVLGTDAALGITDFFQVGTNLLRDAYQVFNANGKVSLVDFPEFAMGINLGFETYNYKNIDSRNPDQRVTSWLPGIVMAFEVLPPLAWFVGGNLYLTHSELKTEGIETSGYVQGASLESDLTWAYNPPKKGGKLGNALSAGATYNITYKIFGIGMSHHWPGFQLGIHYYVNADHYQVQPIVAGGLSVDF